jgi:hypothetical protein
MKSGSPGIEEMVPAGTSKCRSAASVLSLTLARYLGHQTSTSSSAGMDSTFDHAKLDLSKVR